MDHESLEPPKPANRRSNLLWQQASEDLARRESELLKESTKLLPFQGGVANVTQRFKQYLDEKVEQREMEQWVIKLGRKSMKVREVGDKIIGFLTALHGLIEHIAALEPHTAIAWTALSSLLPVRALVYSTTPRIQRRLELLIEAQAHMAF